MRHLALPVVAAFALVAVQPAAAQDSGTLKKIKDSGSITLGHRDTSIPFSYYDDKQQVVGYAMDICMKIVDAVKAELKLQKLDVKLNPVTSATRIPLMANGTIDLECGSTTNNLDRQKQVSFTNTHFVTANRYVAKKASKIEKLADLKGKTVVSTAGTTNIKWLTEENQKQSLGMNIIAAKDHAESFLMVDTGRASGAVVQPASGNAAATATASPPFRNSRRARRAARTAEKGAAAGRSGMVRLPEDEGR